MSTNNLQAISNKMTATQHYALRKLSVGVASVLLGTTVMMINTAHADRVTSTPQTVETSEVQNGSSPLSGVNGDFSNSQSSNSNELNNEVQQNNQNVLVANSSTGSQEQDQQSLSKINNSTSSMSGMSSDLQNQRFAGLRQSLVQQSNNGTAVRNVHASFSNIGDLSPHYPNAEWDQDMNLSFDVDLSEYKNGDEVKIGSFDQSSDTGRNIGLWRFYDPRVLYKGKDIGYLYVRGSDDLSMPLYFHLLDKPQVTGSLSLTVSAPRWLRVNYNHGNNFRGIPSTHVKFQFKGMDGSTFNVGSYIVNQPHLLYYDQYKGHEPISNDYFTNTYEMFNGEGHLVFNVSHPEFDSQQLASYLSGNVLDKPLNILNKNYMIGYDLNSSNDLLPNNIGSNVYFLMPVVDHDRYVVQLGAGYGYASSGATNAIPCRRVQDGLTISELKSLMNPSKSEVLYSVQDPRHLILISNLAADAFYINQTTDQLYNGLSGAIAISATTDPAVSTSASVDAISKVFQNYALHGSFWIRFHFADPTLKSTVRVKSYDLSSNKLVSSTIGTSSISTSTVKGQSTVKLHVITPSGVALQQVKSFTDWPDQNKHASLSIPSITGYELVSNPQAILSALHLSGTAISASTQVDYPAENTVADYYVVLQPKTESANVQIVDADESNKVLATGTVSGQFGQQIVSNADIQSKLDALIKTGHYTLSSNGFDSGTDYKDGTNTVTISLKHKLDSIQRHYRVIEDLPDGTKKVIIDMEATLYKDAARSDWQEYGAYTKDWKLLKRNEVKLLKQTNILDTPGTAMDYVNATVDSVTGYRHYIDRNIDRKSYPHYGGYYGGLGVWDDNSTVWMDLFRRGDPHDGVGFATNVFPSTDFHIVYAPKDEAATVNIIDVDENNKVLSTSTVTGKFNTQIVTNDDVQAKLKSLLDTGHYVLQSNGFDQVAKYQDGTNTITIALKHKIDSTQRHYRVIEDLPDGTKKVIVDYQITFYKDAASKYYNRMGAVTVDTLKLLKPNSVQMNVGNYSFPNDNTSAYSAIDKVSGYSYQMIDDININSYDNGVVCQILTNSQMAQLPPTTFNKADFKDLVIFDLFLCGSNEGGFNLISNPQNIGCVESPLASRDFHIEYSRHSYPVTVNYYDIDGKLVDSVTSTHKFGDTVSIAPVAPTNYVLVSGQAKTDYLMRSGLNEADFLVEPKVMMTTQTKTVSRTIKVQAPDGQLNNVVQTVTFTRNGYLNQVTKQITYSPWSFGGQYQFSGYQPKPVDGYTADVISTVTVTPDSLDTTVNVAYHQISAVYSVAYQLANGTVVKNVSVTPDRDGTIHLTAPQGYRLLTTVTDVQVGPSSQKLAVLVAPAEQTYTVHDDLPSGVTEPLIKTVTRTVKITMPNGHIRTVKQSVKFERTVTVKADGTVSYGDWQAIGRAQFNKVFVPKRRGYHLVITDASGKALTAVEKINTVTAAMNDAVVSVKYVKD